MKPEYKKLTYYKYRKSVITLALLGLFVTALYLLTRESEEPVKIGYIILPPLVSCVLIIVISFMRKVTIGSIIGVDLDYKTAYELLKRKETEKNKYHNLRLLLNLYFMSGDFENVFRCTQELSGSGKIDDICVARHTEIMTDFITGNYADLPALIECQENMLSQSKKMQDAYNVEYVFIKAFLSKDYNKAVSVIEKLLSDKSTAVMNNKKVIGNYLLRMAYMELNDPKKVQACTNEIIKADLNNNTVFRRMVEFE